MAEKKAAKKEKMVDVKFNIKKMDLAGDETTIYGIRVEKKDGNLCGKVEESIFNSLKDAGRV